MIELGTDARPVDEADDVTRVFLFDRFREALRDLVPLGVIDHAFDLGTHLTSSRAMAVALRDQASLRRQALDLKIYAAQLHRQYDRDLKQLAAEIKTAAKLADPRATVDLLNATVLTDPRYVTRAETVGYLEDFSNYTIGLLSVSQDRVNTLLERSTRERHDMKADLLAT